MPTTLPAFRRLRENSRLILLYLFPAAFFSGHAPCQQQKAFSVKDDIAMVRFNDPAEEANAFTQDCDLYSPDRKYVAVVTTKGLLATDQVQSSISVFDLRAVERFLQSSSYPRPRPRVVATVTAIPYGEQTTEYAPVIKDVRWSGDGKQLYFRGQNERGGYQLYEAGVGGNAFRILTPSFYDVDRYDLAGNTIVYKAAPMDAPRPLPGIPINKDALDVTGYRLDDILFPGQMTSFESRTYSMFVLHLGGQNSVPQKIPGYSVPDTPVYLYTLPLRLSPDGTRVVSVEPVTGDIPESWERYDPVPLLEYLRLRSEDPNLTRPDNIMRVRQYVLINLVSGEKTPLVAAPHAQALGYYADANRVAWSNDETRVLLPNVFFPASPDAPTATAIPTKPCAVASVDLPSLNRRCLYFDGDAMPFPPGHVSGVRFGRDRDEAVVSVKQDNKEQELITFHLVGNAWKLVSEVPIPSNGDAVQQTAQQSARYAPDLRLYMRQSLNDAPALWAFDPRTKEDHLLWNANPQLERLAFGEASIYRWKDPTGREWMAGLVKPVGYVPGHRYPLVIQMYMFREHQFLTDGTDPSAFAARHLASAGFVVLQIQKQPNVLSDEDAQTSLAGYRSAIQRLSEDGLIDPNRVGVVGFSWTCWYAVNAIVKAPQLFAAATIADGLDNSYMQYMLFAPDDPNLQDQMKRIRGGRPIGAGLDRWIKEAPGFHLDQARTPVRIETINPASILQEWELYASLRMQHTPVDMTYIPNGTHIHRRPLERFESQQGNVDWMRFWLQGYEDPDPAKRPQYQRWRKLRAGLAAVRSKAASN
jgi:dipeptidyl aminopeptidase/acylaminoacyl peptidase